MGRLAGGGRNESLVALAYDFESAMAHVDGLVRSLVRRMLGRRKDKTLFDKAVNQPVATRAPKQPIGIPNLAQINPGPQSPPQGTKHHLDLEDERLVIESLPAVRVAARRIYRLLPGHVSFAKIYSAGVMGLVGALDEFHRSNLVQFEDFARLKIRNAILDSLPNLVREAEEQRRKGKSIEAAIHELRSELDRPPTELEISHELRLDLATYRHVLGELDGIEIGTLHSQRVKGSAEEDLVNLGSWPEGGSRLRLQRADLTERLTDAIRNLPERERLILNLSFYEELTLKEIALVLDELEPRVSQTHASAILHLRSELSDFGYS
jgi:RNA polymerase sigma factor for flagellar operon FliA